MKITQILSIALIALFAILSLTGCADKDNSNATTETTSAQAEEVIMETTLISDSDNTEWKKFLYEYEEWVDNYIELIQKRQKNPTDMSLLSDYNEMAQQATEWSEKAEKISNELKKVSAEELKEYNTSLSRIIDKLNKAIS